MPRSSAEDQIQKACVYWLHIQEAQGRLAFFAVPNGGKRSAATGALLKATGTRAGVPDITILFPSAKALFVELKAPKGTLQPSQKEWRDKLQGYGFAWGEARSLEDLIALVSRGRGAGFRCLTYSTPQYRLV